MRRTIVTAHLWLGLAVGLLWALQGLTGAALAFHRELDRWAIPAVSTGAMASLDRIVSIAENESGARVVNVGIADSGGGLLNVHYDRRGIRQMQVEAATGRPIRDRSFEPATPVDGSAWRWVYLLHEELLLHGRGKALVGASGLLLLSSLVMGLWIGWPRRGQWDQAFRWSRWRSTRARLFGWHRLAGVFAGLLLVVTIPGGIWMTFSVSLRPALAATTDFQLPYQAKPVETLETVIAPQRALDEALALFPGAAFVRITMPTPAAPVYLIRLRQPDEIRAWSGVTSVTVDAVTGRTLATYDAVKAPLANRLSDAAFSVHSGEVAGIGGRILVMLAGLSLPALFVTGLWSWLRRKRRKGFR